MPCEWSLALQLFEVDRNRAAFIDVLDMFSGAGNLCKAMSDNGLSAMPFEINNDPIAQDCLSLAGVQNFLQMLARTRGHGTQCVGFVCVARHVGVRCISLSTEACAKT